MIYLDYNATTPIDHRVAEAMMPYITDEFGNPSSSHAMGARAKNAVEESRNKVAMLLGCKSEEIVFTSGGSESNNYIIKGVAHRFKKRETILSPRRSSIPPYLTRAGFLNHKDFKYHTRQWIVLVWLIPATLKGL